MSAKSAAPRLSAAALATFLVASPLRAATVARPEAPEAFLRRIYAPYVRGDQHVSPTGKDAAKIFDVRLSALIHKDQVNAKGEIGALDQDPICDCQDFGRLTALSIKLRQGDQRRAIASVLFLNGSTPASLTYKLVSTRSGWRVADVGSKDIPSLTAFLEKTSSSH